MSKILGWLVRHWYYTIWLAYALATIAAGPFEGIGERLATLAIWGLCGVAFAYTVIRISEVIKRRSIFK